MKSPSDMADYKAAKATASAPAAPMPFTRRGYRDTETATTAVSTAVARDAREPFGAVAQLPLAIQATFRRKLSAIIALQLGVVGLLVALLEFVVHDWLNDNLADSTSAWALLAGALIALVAILNCVRDRHPVNWVVLAWLTAVLVLCLATADVALDSHIVLLNCAFTWVFVTGLVLTAGWTQPAHARFNCCDARGMAFGWSPQLASSSPSFAADGSSTKQRVLVSPFVPGFLSFLVACGVLTAVDAVGNNIGATRDAVLISFFVQLIVSCWFLFQIDSSHHRLTPDAYMSGVVYFYADTLVVVGALVATLLLAVACMGCSDVGGATTAGATLWEPFYPPVGTTSDNNEERV